MKIIQVNEKDKRFHTWTADHEDIPGEFEKRYGRVPDVAYQLNGVVFVPLQDGERKKFRK